MKEKLAVLGLNEKENDEFTDFRLRFMDDHPYNVISFRTNAYKNAAQLSISPQPDSVIRVFMTCYTSDEAVDIPSKELTSDGRLGFTAVEWGGQMVK